MNSEQIIINLENDKIIDSFYQNENSTIPIDINTLIDFIINANETKNIVVIKENDKITKWRK
jgi:hypothetical protein